MKRNMVKYYISIHSPHARGDSACWLLNPVFDTISIHSPHARGDLRTNIEDGDYIQFQSTPLTRGETL